METPGLFLFHWNFFSAHPFFSLPFLYPTYSPYNAFVFIDRIYTHLEAVFLKTVCLLFVCFFSNAGLGFKMSYMLPHLHSGWEVDQAIVTEEEKVVIIRFGWVSESLLSACNE